MNNTPTPITGLTGFLLINKPVDITSFDCIRKLKKILPKKTTIGHAGTLDPFASGLLIIAIGREATKKISILVDMDKEYAVKAKLGELTASLDKTGIIIETKACSGITLADLERAGKELQPSYTQVPPAYSALKHEGRPLYSWIREKNIDSAILEQIVKDKAREVSIYSLEIISYNYPFFTVKTRVSKGTYIRSLANDLAIRASGIATCYELERTKIGPFDVAQACDISKLCTAQDISDNLISIADMQRKLSK